MLDKKRPMDVIMTLRKLLTHKIFIKKLKYKLDMQRLKQTENWLNCKA